MARRSKYMPLISGGFVCAEQLVCTENPIRVDDVTESPKLAE
jgi:hypothetical protein